MVHILSALYIENIAVISSVELNIADGLSIFTGETGAGKTILMNAIAAVLGAKISKDIIRFSEKKAKVSAIFENIPESIAAQIEELGYDVEDGVLQISREITPEKTVAKIGTRTASLSVLRSVAELLIDIHGQHDSRDLMNHERHINFIDKFGELDVLLEEYRTIYLEYNKYSSQLETVDTDVRTRLERQDILSYQLDEIDNANISLAEERELRLLRDKIRNFQTISNLLSNLYVSLHGTDDMASSGAIELIENIIDNSEKLSEYLPDVSPISENISNIKYELDELSILVRNSLNEQSDNTEKLDDIEARLALLERLKHKYGGTLEKVLEYRDRISNELENLNSYDKNLEKLRTQCEKLRKSAYSVATKLSEERKKFSAIFCNLINEKLNLLNMSGVSLFYEHTEKSELSPNGIDDMQLMIRANAGEQAKPLSKTASGGELSRVMLAIKVVLAQKDDIPTIIFDEIDTGVSGETGSKIGASLAEVAKSRQVLCVTHLAQVAAFADNHFFISKHIENERTYTEISELNSKERPRELARISVGDNLTKSAIESASELISSAQNIKNNFK